MTRARCVGRWARIGSADVASGAPPHCFGSAGASSCLGRPVAPRGASSCLGRPVVRAAEWRPPSGRDSRSSQTFRLGLPHRDRFRLGYLYRICVRSVLLQADPRFDNPNFVFLTSAKKFHEFCFVIYRLAGCGLLQAVRRFDNPKFCFSFGVACSYGPRYCVYVRVTTTDRGTNMTVSFPTTDTASEEVFSADDFTLYDVWDHLAGLGWFALRGFDQGNRAEVESVSAMIDELARRLHELCVPPAVAAPSGDPLSVWLLDYTVVEAGSQSFVTGRQSVYMTRQGAEHALAALLSETVPAGVFRIRSSDQAAEDRLWAAGVPAGDPADDGAAEIIASSCSESGLCVDLDAAGEGVEIHAGIARMVVGL